jgi:hypothetical protein
MKTVGRLLLLLLLVCDWAAETPFSPAMTSTECVWHKVEGAEPAHHSSSPVPPTLHVWNATSLPLWTVARLATDEPGPAHPRLIYVIMSLRC